MFGERMVMTTTITNTTSEIDRVCVLDLLLQEQRFFFSNAYNQFHIAHLQMVPW